MTVSRRLEEECPRLMALGMSYETYWNGDVRQTEPFLRSVRAAERRRAERVNAEAHLFGMYFYEALCDVSPLLHAFPAKRAKPHPYRAEPYPLFGPEGRAPSEREAARREEAERLRAELYMRQMIRAGKNWGKGR